jgi:hypothetical protein
VSFLKEWRRSSLAVLLCWSLFGRCPPARSVGLRQAWFISSGRLRLSRRGRARDLVQVTSRNVIDEAMDRDPTRDKRMGSNSRDVVNNTLLGVGDGEPIDVCGLSRARPGTDIGEAIGAQLCRLETVRKHPSHYVVGEELHPAVRVVDDEPLAGAEELVRNDQRTNRIITCSSARISNDVCVTFGQPGLSRWIQSRVHTGQDREVPCRRERQLSLCAKRSCVLGVGSKYVISCSHRRLSSSQGK